MPSFARLMCAVTLLAVAGTSTPAFANGAYDHLKCFKIRDSLTDRRTIYLADVYPNAPFGMRKDCRLRLPALHFCVNVSKENVLVNGEPFATLPVPSAEEARDYLCYDLKCDRDRLEVGALDQFGARTLRTRKSDFLCMPASKVTVSPSPTLTPTPTPTPTDEPTPEPNPCQLIIDAQGDGDNLVGDFCGGDCPPGEACLATVTARGPETCQCVPEEARCGERPIGTGPPPFDGMCGGLCQSPFAMCSADLARGPGICTCVLN